MPDSYATGQVSNCPHPLKCGSGPSCLAHGNIGMSAGYADLGLPESLLDRLEPGAFRELAPGRLGNQLFRVWDKVEGPAYLKIGTGIAGQDQINEAARLGWIGNCLPVPRVLHCTTNGTRSLVLVTELPGVPSHECFEAISMRTAVEKLAEGLRMIHTVSTENCPFDSVLEYELEESARRISSPCLNLEAFIADTGAAPSRVLDDLVARATQVGDFVFTHGDYCFPNLLIDEQRIVVSLIGAWQASVIGTVTSCPSN